MSKTKPKKKAMLNSPPAEIEEAFPAVAQWVRGYGHIEIGDQDNVGFLVRALDYGGLVFEDDRPRTLAEGMAALEKRLAEWFKEQGIKLGWSPRALPCLKERQTLMTERTRKLAQAAGAGLHGQSRMVLLWLEGRQGAPLLWSRQCHRRLRGRGGVARARCAARRRERLAGRFYSDCAGGSGGGGRMASTMNDSGAERLGDIGCQGKINF